MMSNSKGRRMSPRRLERWGLLEFITKLFTLPKYSPHHVNYPNSRGVEKGEDTMGGQLVRKPYPKPKITQIFT